MSDEVTVRRAGLADAPAVMRALGQGCLDEAVFSWVVPDGSARQERTVAWTGQAAAWVGGMLEEGVLLVAEHGAGEIAGLSLWELLPADPAAGQAPPAEPAPGTTGSPGTDTASGEPTGSAEETARFIPVYGPEYAPRMALVSELTRRRHPRREPHWYLQQMVVVPTWRGHGLGGAMLRHQLELVDTAGLGAYLEASSARNRKLYERHGFRAHGDPIRLPEDGPAIQPMWRPPAAGQR
ncbi:GNAT family N-acetyltransferase [Plantactinospora sonchi]|uniref:GNAT family N-acetyltransferase n=1 Tax=Plantactinospora sonchi TaxID=1544735 RepID=A0ABU7RY99_9ACTN